jgi:hypothetical protein
MRITIQLALAATALAATPALAADVPRPAALVADGMPAVPAELAASSRPYMEFRSASFAGWNARDRSMLVRTRFANVPQLHRVAGPLTSQSPIPIPTCSISPAGA